MKTNAAVVHISKTEINKLASDFAPASVELGETSFARDAGERAAIHP